MDIILAKMKLELPPLLVHIALFIAIPPGFSENSQANKYQIDVMHVNLYINEPFSMKRRLYASAKLKVE